MKKNRELPVYTIGTFRKVSEENQFYIRRLDHHIGEFSFTHAPHRHDNYLILILTQGTGTHMIDFVDYAAKPFTAYFLSPGQVHAWQFSGDAKGFVIFFTLSFYKVDKRQRDLSVFPFFHTMNAPCVYMDQQRETVLLTLLEEMMKESNAQLQGSEELLRNCLEIIMIRMMRYFEGEQVTPVSTSVSARVRQFETLVDKHFLLLRLPRDYADKMNITSKHLNDISKMALNKTATEIIHERLVLEAKRELAYSTLTTKQLADKLGFNDKSYFIRFVKKHLGETPEHFREKHSLVHHHP